jgi:hypothetical protein
MTHPEAGLPVNVVAAAMNSAQIQPGDIALGHDLRPLARRFLVALDGCPEEGHYVDCDGYVLVKRAEIDRLRAALVAVRPYVVVSTAPNAVLADLDRALASREQ